MLQPQRGPNAHVSPLNGAIVLSAFPVWAVLLYGHLLTPDHLIERWFWLLGVIVHVLVTIFACLFTVSARPREGTLVRFVLPGSLALLAILVMQGLAIVGWWVRPAQPVYACGLICAIAMVFSVGDAPWRYISIRAVIVGIIGLGLVSAFTWGQYVQIYPSLMEGSMLLLLYWACLLTVVVDSTVPEELRGETRFNWSLSGKALVLAYLLVPAYFFLHLWTPGTDWDWTLVWSPLVGAGLIVIALVAQLFSRPKPLEVGE